MNSNKIRNQILEYAASLDDNENENLVSDDLKKAKHKLSQADETVSREDRDREIERLSEGDEELANALKGLYKQHRQAYKKKHPLKSWGKNQVADIVSPISKALPTKIKKKLETMQDYGDSGGVGGTLASIILDPTIFIPVAGVAKKAKNIKNILNIIKKSPAKAAAAGAVTGGTYEGIKESGRNELREEEDQTSLLPSVALGASLGGATGGATSAIIKKLSKEGQDVNLESILGKSVQEFSDVPKAEKKALIKKLESKIKDSNETIGKHFTRKPGSTEEATDKIKDLYQKKDDEFKGLYKKLSSDFEGSGVDAKVFKDFMSEISQMDKINTSSKLGTKDKYEVGDLLSIKNFMSQGAKSEMVSEAKRLKLGRKQQFSDLMNDALSVEQPLLKKNLDSITKQYAEEMVPLRNNKEIRNVGLNKSTEISSNIFKPKTKENDKVLDMFDDEFKGLLKSMLFEEGNYDTNSVVKKITKMPKGTAKKLFGDDYQNIVDHPIMLKTLRNIKTSKDEEKSFTSILQKIGKKFI